MVARKPSLLHIDHTAVQRTLGREGDRMDQVIHLAPLLPDLFKHRLGLAFDADIERHEDRRFELFRQRLDKALRLLVQIGHRDLGTECAEGAGATPGDRLIVGDADDQPPLAFQKRRLRDGNAHAVLFCVAPVLPDAPIAAIVCFAIISSSFVGTT